MILEPSSDIPRASLRRARRDGLGGRWSRIVARLRWINVVALAFIVFCVAPSPTRGISRLAAHEAALTSTALRASSPRATRTSHGAVCRLVDPKAEVTLTHYVRPRYDGSAIALHERDTSKGELDDSDLDDGRDASCDADAPAALRSTGRGHTSGCTSRGTAETDPSRFTAGRGLPRGPPV